MTSSYLVTDLRSKWKEIELDRDGNSAENIGWSPFAKAMQDAKLKYLSGLNLKHALILRQEGRLEDLRSFLFRIWREARSDQPFDESNSVILANELHEKVREAESEWKKIDSDLIKILGTGTASGALAAGPLISDGHGAFLAAAGLIGSGATAAWQWMTRRRFPKKYPASFFMNVTD